MNRLYPSGRFAVGIVLSLFICAALLYAHSTGPTNPHTGATWLTGMPGPFFSLDEPTCAASCHNHSATENSRGTMTLSFSGGNTYTPGIWKRVTITITPNPGTSNSVQYGFQATARLSGTNTRAGRFDSSYVDPNRQAVKCAATLDAMLTSRTFMGCGATELEYIQHTQAYTGQGSASFSLSFLWQPPASNAGDVTFNATSVLSISPVTDLTSYPYRTSATLSYQTPATFVNPVYPVGTLGVEALDTPSNRIFKFWTTNLVPLFNAAVNRDGSRLYTSYGNQFGTLLTFNPQTGQQLSSLPNYGGAGLALSPDESRLYVAGTGSGLLVLDSGTGASIADLSLNADTGVLAVSCDGKRVYVAQNGSGSVGVVDSTTLSLLAPIVTAAAPIGLAVSPDSSKLYVTTADNELTIFSTATRSILGQFPLEPDAGPVVFSPNGLHAYVLSTGTFQKITTVNVATSMPVGLYTITNYPGYSPILHISPDGAYLYGTANILYGAPWDSSAWSLAVDQLGIPAGPPASIPSAQGVMDIAVPAPSPPAEQKKRRGQLTSP